MMNTKEISTRFSREIQQGARFKFGKNWLQFLSVVDDHRIDEAERSLRERLGVEGLAGKTFLDAGSGSGLFSLAAMRLGAERVYSFDYDPQSVACTQELRQRYNPGASNWIIHQGSASTKIISRLWVSLTWSIPGESSTIQEICGRPWGTCRGW